MTSPIQTTKPSPSSSNETKPHSEAASVVIIKPPLLASFAIVAALVLAGVIWAFIAKIPLKTSGIGVLIDIGEVSYRIALGDGNIVYNFDKQGSIVAPRFSQLIYQFAREPGKASLEQMLALSKTINDYFPRFGDRLRAPVQGASIRKGSIFAQIDNPAARESLFTGMISAANTISAYLNEIKAITEETRLARVQLIGEGKLLSEMRQLGTRGYVSVPTILKQEQSVDTLKTTIAENEAKISETTTKMINEREKQRKNLSEYINKYILYAETDMYVIYPDFNQYESVKEGQNAIIFSFNPVKLPISIPVFLPSKSANLIQSGDRILATPMGFQKSRYGGIEGRIDSISETPVSLKSVSQLTGITELGKSIQEITSVNPIMAKATLFTSKNSKPNQGIYKWSSQSNPPSLVRPSERLYVDVTSEEVHPISLVLPALKTFFGYTYNIPNQGTESNPSEGSK